MALRAPNQFAPNEMPMSKNGWMQIWSLERAPTLWAPIWRITIRVQRACEWSRRRRRRRQVSRPAGSSVARGEFTSHSAGSLMATEGRAGRAATAHANGSERGGHRLAYLRAHFIQPALAVGSKLTANFH